MTPAEIPWAQHTLDGDLSMDVDVGIYPLQVLFRVCYAFTDRCYLFLTPSNDGHVVKVRFARRSTGCELETIVGEFSNELVNQRVRLEIANETRAIRELIVAQAFTEADLIDRSGSEGSYIEDPRGVGIAK